MKNLPLLSRAFEDQTIESFYKHAKDLTKPQKQTTKTKTRKKKSDDNTSGRISDPETNRETETHVGIIETA